MSTDIQCRSANPKAKCVHSLLCNMKPSK